MTKRIDELSDADVDKELKRVQLQRERLQLEKELARKKWLASANSFILASSYYSLNAGAKAVGFVSRIFASVGRNIKKIAAFALLSIAIFAGIYAYEDMQVKSFRQAKEEGILKSCGEYPDYDACISNGGSHSSCAFAYFEKSRKHDECRIKSEKDLIKLQPFLLFHSVY
ncbi:hypothetical protein ACCQ08_25585 [Comamonas sp. SY3]|uniref:hypothetical protein n=1 Tax=Comamonas sp. SY3 TaxID=3243601 RepID=UPI003592F280